MPRWFPRQVLTLTLLMLSTALSGCDNDVFAPPTRGGKSSNTIATPVPSRAKEIVFIFPAEENHDLQVIGDLARLEVGRSRAAYVEYRVNVGDPPSKQAEFIKQAVAGGASAIVLVADKAPETAAAIAAVDQKKTPIVLIGRLPAGLKPGSSTLVTWPSFASSARQIVDATLEDAKKAGFPDDAPVLLLVTEPPDEFSSIRATALTEALKATTHPIAAKIQMIDDAVSSLAFTNALKTHPKVCAVISDDGLGSGIATTVRMESKEVGNYLLGSYSHSPTSLKLVAMNQASIVVDRNLEGIVRKAIDAAIDRGDGKTVPDRIEVELMTRRGTGISASANFQIKK